MQRRLDGCEFALADYLGNGMGRNCEFRFDFEHGTPFAIPFDVC